MQPLPLSVPRSGPLSVPLIGPLIGPLSGPLICPLNGPPSCPLSGPLTGPLNGPLSGRLSGPLMEPINGRLSGPLLGALCRKVNPGIVPRTEEAVKEQLSKGFSQPTSQQSRTPIRTRASIKSSNWDATQPFTRKNRQETETKKNINKIKKYASKFIKI